MTIADSEVEQSASEAPAEGVADASTPEVQSQASPVDAPPESVDETGDWSALGGPSTDDGPEEVPAAPPAPAQVAPAQQAPALAPQPGQPAAPNVAQQPQLAPQPSPAPQQAPVAVQQTAQPAPAALSDPQTISDVLTLFSQREADMVAAIAGSEYALSPAEKEALEADYTAALPSLMAKVQMRAMAGTLHFVNKMLPAMVQQIAQRTTVQQQAQTDFFTQFPHLNKPELHQEIAQVGMGLRSAYPNMPAAELVKMIGQAVSLRYPGQAPVQRAPAAARPVPFAPAVAPARAATMQPPRQVDGNDWMNGMARDWE